MRNGHAKGERRESHTEGSQARSDGVGMRGRGAMGVRGRGHWHDGLQRLGHEHNSVAMLDDVANVATTLSAVSHAEP